MKYLISIIFVLSVIGCSSSSGPITPSLDKEFGIKFGQSVTLEDEPLTIKFKSVVEDSRCPTGAECPWEGNAKIIIEISQTDIELNTTLEPKQANYLEYIIQLTAVNPYPKLNEQLRQEDYSIKLIVSKS